MRPADDLVPLHMFDRQPSWFVYGGLVFITLSVPYLASEFSAAWDRLVRCCAVASLDLILFACAAHCQAPIRLTEKVLYGEKPKPDSDVVILVQILTAEPNIGCVPRFYTLLKQTAAGTRSSATRW